METRRGSLKRLREQVEDSDTLNDPRPFKKSRMQSMKIDDVTATTPVDMYRVPVPEEAILMDAKAKVADLKRQLEDAEEELCLAAFALQSETPAELLDEPLPVPGLTGVNSDPFSMSCDDDYSDELAQFGGMGGSSSSSLSSKMGSVCDEITAVPSPFPIQQPLDVSDEKVSLEYRIGYYSGRECNFDPMFDLMGASADFRNGYLAGKRYAISCKPRA